MDMSVDNNDKQVKLKNAKPFMYNHLCKYQETLCTFSLVEVIVCTPTVECYKYMCS